METMTTYTPESEDRLWKIILSDDRKTQVLKDLRDFVTNLEKDKLSEYGKHMASYVEKIIDGFFLFENNADKALVLMDQTNQNFNKRLLSTAPDLTISELKLCNLLALNLSNLEISEVLGIEASSVSVKKYRIKKKLGLKNNDLLSYILSLKIGP